MQKYSGDTHSNKIVQIIIDDIIFRSTNEKLCKDFESCMKKESEISMMEGSITSLNSKSSKRMMRSSSIKSSIQKKLIKKFGLEDVKISKTPMAIITKLDKDEQGKNIDIKLYCSMIDSLLYLTASRPNIMFSFYLCARF